MRILVCGDIVGRSGRDAVAEHLPGIKNSLKIDLTIINAENAAHGFGLSAKICDKLFAVGADVLTTGNHVYDQREIIPYLDSCENIVRPANYPVKSPGRGMAVIKLPDGRTAAVMQVMGRFGMDPLDCPFAAFDRLTNGVRLGKTVNALVVDIHAEATSEKMGFGHFADGRASAVVGSHTHVPTADHSIFPGGTGYITDLGMTGDYDSVIGMKKDEPVSRFLRRYRMDRFAPAEGEATLCGVFIETDDSTGLATRIEPVRAGGRLSQSVPVL